MLAYVCYSLTNTLIEVVENLELHNPVIDGYINDCQQTFANHNYSENYETIRSGFLSACNYIYKLRFKSNSDLKNAIITYTEEKYNVSDISLRQMATDLHVSYNYLCRFFKEQTGMVFLDYLHNLRIEKSKELLKNTNKAINDIALEIGYLNANSYIRKFKQITNLTPGEYRKI